MRKLRILTPELVPLEYSLAGLPERGLAWLLDEILVFMATIAVWLLAALVGMLTGGFGMMPAAAGAMVAGFALDFGYRWWAEVRWRGRTLGKRALGLRVVQDNGAPVLAWQAFVRNAARVLDALPMFHLVGAVSILADPLARRVGDRLAGTVVLRERAYAPPKAARVLAHAENSVARDGSAAARIRQRLTEREGVVLAEFVVAAPRIETSRRLALAARLAGHYRARLGLAAHADLPDETLLRGIVGVLARERFGSPSARR